MITINLMELADIGTPKAIAQNIIKNNPDIALPIPIEEIAKSAGIKKIEYLNNVPFEGTLIANSNKTEGIIACNDKSNFERKRFTIAHELGHFLIPTHSNKLTCVASNISYTNQNSFINKEQEANCFASNILLPLPILNKEFNKIKFFDLHELEKLRQKFTVSYEAFIRALVNGGNEPMAFVFAENNIIKYYVASSDFPYLNIYPKTKLPITISSQLPYEITETVERDCDFWLNHRITSSLYEQHLIIKNKFSITMLTLD